MAEPGVCAKDVMLHILSQEFFKSGKGIGKVLEFAGDGVRSMALDERATLTNMAVEAGGFTGIIEADETIVEYMVKQRGMNADAVRASIVKADPGAEYLLAAASEGAPPAGVCQLRYRHSLWTASEDCWLEDLFVEDSARRAGLGEALVACAIERARARGCGRVELDVSQSNRAAWALYERMGFSAGYKPPAPNVLMGLWL